MKMENIPGFLFVYGASIIIAIMMVVDVFRKKEKGKPFKKWIAVIVLSVWQIISLRALANFGTAFGNNSKMTGFELGFIAVVILWLIFQVVDYSKSERKSNTDSSNF